MQRIKRKYMLINLILTFVVLLLSTLALRLMGYGWNLLQLIPVVFFYWAVYHLGFLWLLRMTKRNPKRMPLNFSIVKGVRFIVLILYAVFYCTVAKGIALQLFLIVYGIFYIIWLSFDTIFFFRNDRELLKSIVPENENS